MINEPNQPPKLVAHWLNLLADLQIRGGADYDSVRQTLEKIIERFPDMAVADLARSRLDHLKLEIKGEQQETPGTKLGVYEQNIGLKFGSPHRLQLQGDFLFQFMHEILVAESGAVRASTVTWVIFGSTGSTLIQTFRWFTLPYIERTLLVASCGMYSVMQHAVVVQHGDGRLVNLVRRPLIPARKTVLAERHRRRPGAADRVDATGGKENHADSGKRR